MIPSTSVSGHQTWCCLWRMWKWAKAEHVSPNIRPLEGILSCVSTTPSPF